MKIPGLSPLSVANPSTYLGGEPGFTVDSFSFRQLIPTFNIDRPFSWQTIDLFLGLFSSFGRPLIWQIDEVVEFVQVCSYFMLKERFLTNLFYDTLPQTYCRAFANNQFCQVLFALKSSGYLFLAHSLCCFASLQFVEIFLFEDLLLASSSVTFQQVVERRLSQFLDD